MKMTPLLTKSDIKQLCGSTYYTRGNRYFEEGRVTSLMMITDGSVDDCYEWIAEVRGKSKYSVAVQIAEDYIDGYCNCPAYSEYDSACKHIAAVLLAVEAKKLPAISSPAFTEELPADPYSTNKSPESDRDNRATIAYRGSSESNEFNEHSRSLSNLFPGLASRPNARASNETIKPKDLSKHLLSLFRSTKQTQVESPFNAQTQVERFTTLRVEFICKPTAKTYARSDYLCLEMKVGPKQTYVVKKIREFLQAIKNDELYTFTPKFTYDPAQHRFDRNHLAVIHDLQAIHEQEAMFKEMAGYSSFSRYRSPMNDDRSLIIPPSAWPSLYPKLVQSSTQLMDNGRTKPLQVVTGNLPITASVTAKAKDMYALEVEGLTDLLFLPSYNSVVSSTAVHQLDAATLQQLEGLRSIMDAERMDEISFSTDSLESIMNEVLPQVKHIAETQVDETISNRVIEFPLEAKLYLDKETVVTATGTADELSALLQFTYGDIVIDPYYDEYSGNNPFAATSAGPANAASNAAFDATGHAPGHSAADIFANAGGREDHQILIRDWTKEEQILQMMDDCPFQQDSDSKSLYIDGEEEIYRFLFEQMPTLRELVQVYATSAVDSWMQPSSFTPRARVELDEKTNWLDVSFDMGDLDDTEILNILRSMIERKKYHRLANGSFLSLQDDSFRQVSDIIGNLGIQSTELSQSKMQLPALRALSLMEHQLSDGHPGWNVRLGKSLRRWLDNLRNPDNLETPLPQGIHATLREYQIFGYQWMKTMSKYGFGGILADDMGLGKTLQSISYLLSEREQASEQQPSKQRASEQRASEQQPSKQPALIVCPASLTFNWLNEIEKFTPSLTAVVASGTKSERQSILDSASQYDVIITSYPLLWRDIESYKDMLFSTLILDEAQAIKNPHTQTAQAVFQIRSNHRFALTGTPVENSLDDLWSIFHAVFPELLGGKTAFSELNSEAVTKRVRPFLLRRVKQDVLKELPEKIEMVHTAELTTDQKKHYMAYLTQLQNDTLKGLEQEGFQKGRIRILAGLTRLRQICCHPSLCIENYRGKSGKMEQLLELVDEYISSKQRMLIFSQFTSMLEILRKELTKRGIPYFYLDGQTPSKQRLQLCQDFNEGDAPVFLISLKAGGTGLNLTGADTVILYDLWWNPAVEQQAADRAHRIGQKRNVQVIRMVSKGTIEEKIYQLQDRKRHLIDSVVQANDEGLGALTEQDVRELLMI
ncbi:DEAD/DEAH box helicase [Alicyclobacillus sp. SO9]|uniref:DEAD/DEAH box helicase n=1 Tax=Alicyclobacillus sp. SO9 TaxID=2665646 RepID=UPI0018E7D7CC|nr:DEAD/DEAH box helicase [Alicyclobacillus sp. SO9]QQE79161.1 SNF2 helicase associated domain-containing protein [Alicyclobacillus sp. SO9]